MSGNICWDSCTIVAQQIKISYTLFPYFLIVSAVMKLVSLLCCYNLVVCVTFTVVVIWLLGVVVY